MPEKMSVTRTNEFRAQNGTDDSLRDFLTSILPSIQSSPGCRTCQLLRCQDDPLQFMIIETWDSIEAHQASVKNIPREQLTKVMGLLALPPSGHYWG